MEPLEKKSRTQFVSCFLFEYLHKISHDNVGLLDKYRCVALRDSANGSERSLCGIIDYVISHEYDTYIIFVT